MKNIQISTVDKEKLIDLSREIEEYQAYRHDFFSRDIFFRLVNSFLVSYMLKADSNRLTGPDNTNLNDIYSWLIPREKGFSDDKIGKHVKEIALLIRQMCEITEPDKYTNLSTKLVISTETRKSNEFFKEGDYFTYGTGYYKVISDTDVKLTLLPLNAYGRAEKEEETVTVHGRSHIKTIRENCFMAADSAWIKKGSQSVEVNIPEDRPRQIEKEGARYLLYWHNSVTFPLTNEIRRTAGITHLSPGVLANIVRGGGTGELTVSYIGTEYVLSRSNVRDNVFYFILTEELYGRSIEVTAHFLTHNGMSEHDKAILYNWFLNQKVQDD